MKKKLTGYTECGMNPFLTVENMRDANIVIDGERFTYNVAPESLRPLILNDDDCPISDAAEQFDENIFCFIPDSIFKSDQNEVDKWMEENF